MQYSFILKDNKQKSFRSFTWFFFFLHIVAAGLTGLNAVDRNVKLSVYILLGIYAVIYSVYYFFRKHKKALDNFSFIMTLLYAGFWMKHAGLTAMFIFLSVYVFVMIVRNKKDRVRFSEDGVHLKRIFKTKTWAWQELDNVILKDGLLTIDIKPNKLLQAEIADGNEDEDEGKFNRFCKEQLKDAVK